jgi:MFS family permease
VFIVSIGLFCVGSLLCGLATTMPLLVAFRGLQGIGAGGIQTSSLIVMGDMFAPRERAKWQVINSIGFATASAIGPSVGGLLSDNFSWRWIFLLNVPVCLATVGALLYGLSSDRRRGLRPAIDWAGGTWSMVGVVTLLLALTLGGRDFAWTSPEILAMAAVAVLAGVLLYRAERSAPEPVIPGHLLRGNIRALSCIAAFGNSMVWFGLILLVPVRLQLVLGNTATVAGALLTPGIVMGPIGSVVAGQLMSRTGRYRVASVLAGVLQVTGMSMLLFSPATSGELWVTLSFVIASMGTGFGGPTFMIMYQNVIPQKQLGAGVGLMSLFRQFGASVGTALAGSIVGAGVVAGGGLAMAPFVQRAFVLPFAAAVAVLFAAWFTGHRPLRSSLQESDDHEPAVGSKPWQEVFETH